jgi:ProP effector
MSKASRKAITATIALLAERFPQCFALYERKRVPLKIGIRRDIEAALNGAITPIELSNALRMYCGNSGYLHSTRPGAPRIDLNGKPAGVVTAHESEAARARLKARKQAKAASKPSRPTTPAPKRLSLADLKTAAAARRKATAA